MINAGVGALLVWRRAWRRAVLSGVVGAPLLPPLRLGLRLWLANTQRQPAIVLRYVLYQFTPPWLVVPQGPPWPVAPIADSGAVVHILSAGVWHAPGGTAGVCVSEPRSTRVVWVCYVSGSTGGWCL